MNLNQIFIGCILLLVFNVAFTAESDYWGRYRKKPNVGSQILLAKKVTTPSAEVSKKYPTNMFQVFSIDLDQDGQNDYIVEKKGQRQTCFVKSDLKIQRCEKTSFEDMDGFAYEFFFSAGKNQMLLLLNLSGDDDSSDFTIEKFDSKTWKRSRITTVNALIEVDTKNYKGIYWGYPWDIFDIKIVTENGEPSTPIIFENGFDNEPNGTKGPAFIFSGTPTQGESTGQYDKLKSKIKLVLLSDLARRLKTGK